MSYSTVTSTAHSLRYNKIKIFTSEKKRVLKKIFINWFCLNLS